MHAARSPSSRTPPRQTNLGSPAVTASLRRACSDRRMTEPGGDRDRLRLAIIDVRERPAGTVELVLSARLASKQNRIRGIAWRW